MKNIYAIRDRVAQEIVGLRMYTLMVFRTQEEAARYFADAINDQSSILNKHPGDYELIMVGHIIDDTGRIDGNGEPELIITGDTVIALQADQRLTIQRNEERGEKH